jgi:nucleoside-diphosphate-sugar epimerase
LKEGKGCFCSDTQRDFLDMEDFIDVMDLMLDANAPTGVFNISTGEGKSIKQVFDAVAKYLDIDPGDVPIVPPGDVDVPVVVLDPSFTEETFGWKSKVSFEDTITRMLDWYGKYGVSAIHSHLKKTA